MEMDKIDKLKARIKANGITYKLIALHTCYHEHTISKAFSKSSFTNDMSEKLFMSITHAVNKLTDVSNIN